MIKKRVCSCQHRTVARATFPVYQTEYLISQGLAELENHITELARNDCADVILVLPSLNIDGRTEIPAITPVQVS